MSDDLRQYAIDAVRAFQARITAFQAETRAVDSGLIVPQSSARKAREFASMMDAETARLMRAFPEFSPADWEAFIDLLPNVRKLLGMSS